MSENVTHVAVCDDVARLARRHPDIPEAFKQVLDEHLDIARLGAATRSADKWSAELIAWARDNWPAASGHAAAPSSNGKARDSLEGGMAGTIERKLAFVLGALTHRAADRLFKPIFQHCRERYGQEAGIDCSIHCDVYVFYEVFGAGAGGAVPLPGNGGFPTSLENPYQPAVFQAVQGKGAQGAEEYLRVLWQRALIGMHTFAPDPQDMHGWLDNLFTRAQGFKISLDHYRRVVEGGLDTELFRRYVYETHSYDRADPLIRLARDIQRGIEPAPGAVEEALAATTDQSSRYARALKKGMHYLRAGGRLWRREIDEASAKTGFDVGVPERSLTFTP
jgi:hypothetical protein